MGIKEGIDLTGLQTLWTAIKNYITSRLTHKPDIYISTTVPTASDGSNGDVWLIYKN